MWYASAEIAPDGTRALIRLSASAKNQLRKYVAENGPTRLTFSPALPESQKMRGWFEGAIVPLIAYYSDNLDHHSAADRDKVREWLKLEFNAELVTLNGVLHKIGKSTSGRNVFTPYVERVMDWFIPNYEPPQQAIDPEYFKHWRDTIRSFEDGPENYIDYLQQTGILKPKPTQ